MPELPDLPQLPTELPPQLENPQIQQPQQQQIIYVQALNPPPQQLSVFDIFCQCQVPKFERQHQCVGCCTACIPGCGLCCCICYYGAEKLDKCDVCLSGCLMFITSQFMIGWIVACIVGCRMCYSM